MVEIGGEAVSWTDAEAFRQVGVPHEQEGVGGAERSGDEDEPDGERERKESDERGLRHASKSSSKRRLHNDLCRSHGIGCMERAFCWVPRRVSGSVKRSWK